jgi:hypothetical protein
MSLFERASAYQNGALTVLEWLGEGGTVVPRHKADARAKVCIECPHNVPGGALTKVVAEAVRRHLEVKNKLGVNVSGEKKLHQCNICLCQLRLKVHVPIEVIRRHMSREELARFPDYCWQKTEQ